MRRHSEVWRRLAWLLLCCGLATVPHWSCGGNDTKITTPSPAATLAFTRESPSSGSTITVSNGSPPGAFIVRGSGQLSVGLAVNAVTDVPWVQLRVYLLTATGYCGQNLPDSPVWAQVAAGQQVEYAVTGFQVYRLPCDVVGLRALLYTGGDIHTGPPPSPGEMLADVTMPISLSLRQ
jgi:hypothetical protein